MRIGIPTEIREHEHRVAITPDVVKKMVGLEVINGELKKRLFY